MPETLYKVISATRTKNLGTLTTPSARSAYQRAREVKDEDPSAESMIIRFGDDGTIITFVWEPTTENFVCVADMLAERAQMQALVDNSSVEG